MYYEPWLDHTLDEEITPISNMIDQAANDVAMGLNYLDHSQYEYQKEAHNFLSDALQALTLSKAVSQNGYLTFILLGQISGQLEKARDQFLLTDGETERHILSYLENALQDISKTMSLELLLGFNEDFYENINEQYEN